ncbi:MATE family efflux transporter [Oscillatoria sp. FACHB-1407]|uniref:guanitoxin biosynthesis MATE family efflux transporter GntT n=1 Tax=Oscillatoria sp. FACHB-1407 TaxID=2692847 RepID=UPI0016833647|nr:guanitoxin biosynthesis MATE family efflux transporter GntT [Oscillatoria sp. FACHB-1407]MBD2462603.1 MATE family efflux transporter [Oscillatoria sp. FACHB-1407]
MEIRSDFYRSFGRLAVVNILSNLLVPLAGLIDIAFLGHLDEIRHLAGVALATVLFNYIYWTFGFLRMGTTGTTAQALGRGDRPEVWLTGLRNGLLALGLGLLILILQYPLRELGFALLSATPDVKASGMAYFNSLVWGAPATLINFVLVGWFLGQAQGSQVLLLSAVSNLTDVGLNYLLIVQWGWGSAGAGWSTALSQYAMLGVGLWLVSREMPWQQVKAIAPQIPNPAALKAAFSLNTDIMIRTFAMVTTFSVFTNLSSAFGTDVLTTNTLLLQIVTLAAYFIDGLAFATESFAGIFRGKGSHPQLMTLVWLSGSISLGLGLLFAIAPILMPLPIFRLLTKHTDILDQVSQYVGWLMPILGFGSIAYMLDGYFLGLTEGRILKTSTLMATFIGFAPLAAIAWWFNSVQLLWLALAAFMATRALTLSLQVAKTWKPL